jgi:hypothetical protein
MRRLLALSLLVSSLACGCAAGLAAPAAFAAGSTTPLTGATGVTQPSFGLGSGGATTTPAVTTATPVTTTASSSGSLSTLDGVIIGVVVALLLGGVAFWIWYDARGHVARVGRGGDEALFGQRAHAGSKAPRKARKHKPAERKRRKRGRAR